MKRLTIVLLICLSKNLFSQLIPAGSNHKMLDVSKLAGEIEKRYKDKCIGFQFVISYKQHFEVMRSWGESRRRQDAPVKAMSNTDQYNIASVSKPISGAALMIILERLQNVTADSKMYTFLPSHWHIDNTVKVITFKDLLMHTSGFRSGASSYADLKAMVKQGINPADHGVDKYENCNYAIMRLLIPRLAGYSIVMIPPNAPPGLVTGLEAEQAASFAVDYMDFVQKKLFTPAGLPHMQCKPIATHPALCYQFPATGAHGGNFGDATLVCGAEGWNMSSKQLSTFFSHLHETTGIWSAAVNTYMKKLCYEIGTTTKGVSYYEKEGFFPGSENPGELNSVMVGFGNDIIVTGIMNSQGPAWEETVRAAFDAWYQ